jgi:ABC-type branched-subunit amino acid transport system substrate-binding protein
VKVRNRRFVASVSAVALTGVVALGLAAGSVAGAADPGVTDNSVKIGFIFSETGQAGSVFQDGGKACQARVDAENAKGGVNGRKIEIVIKDDQTLQNLNTAKDLAQNENVFAVINDSSTAFLSYHYLQDQGVPIVGGGFDGNYYHEKGLEDIVSTLGNGAPVVGLTYDNSAKVAKQLGATKAAAVGYGSSASSTEAAKSFVNYAAPAAGLKKGYVNTSVEFGTTDVSPLVLGIKNDGSDAVYLPLVSASNFAIVQGLQQNGVDMKANVLATGYGQDLLDSPLAASLQPNTVMFQTYKPVELKNDPAIKKFQATLKKYGGITGVPNYGIYQGYISCDMAIFGLKNAGKDLTRQSFIDGLRKTGTYDVAGLNCSPSDVSLANYGKVPNVGCAYYMYVKDGKFVVMNKGKPIAGKLVGDPELIAANKQGTVVTTTVAPATTAAP